MDKLVNKLLGVADDHLTESKNTNFEIFSDSSNKAKSDNKLKGRFSKNMKDKPGYGTLDNQRLETELYKANNSSRGGIQKSINFNDKKDKVLDSLIKKDETNRNLLENFESFSQQKNQSNLSNGDRNIYNQNYVKKKTKESRLGFGSDISDEKIILKSEKVIMHRAFQPSKKNLIKSKLNSKSSPKKDPYTRFSVKGKFANKIEHGMSKLRFQDKGSVISSGFDDPDPKNMTGEPKISDIGLDYTLVNLVDERLDLDNKLHELESSNIDSFKLPDEAKKHDGSHFSSFSEHRMGKNDTRFSFNPMESFGNRPNEIVLEIVSNWGSPFQVGLTEVKLFDMENEEIKLREGDIKLYNGDRLIETDQLNNIINDRIVSMNQNDMFSIDFSKSRDRYSFKFEVPLTVNIGCIVLWNFNEDPDKGVKDFKLFYGGKEIHSEELRQANGKVSNCMKYNIIKLNSSFNENNLINSLSKEYGHSKNKMVNTTNLPPIQNNSSQKKVKPSRDDLKKIESTPKNKMRGRSEILDKARTPNPSRKSLVPVSNTTSNIKLPSDISIDSKKKIRSKLNMEERVDRLERINKKKLIPNKLSPIIKSRSMNVFSNFSSLQEIIESYSDKTIPTKPLINGLTCKLLSNWDDKNTIGLNGIEIFNLDGKCVKLTGRQVKIISSSNKIVPNQVSKDNLVDDGLHTCDENKHWSYPLESNLPLTIKIKFEMPEYVSMIRVWNYNCSRTHASKGVREIIIADYEDKQLLFGGCLRKASGMLMKPKLNFESIFFVREKRDLAKIAGNDWLYNKFSKKQRNEVKRKIKNHYNDFLNQRPTMTDLDMIKEKKKKSSKFRIKEHMRSGVTENKPKKYSNTGGLIEIPGMLGFRLFKMSVFETWGHQKEFGLVGVEFYTPTHKLIPESYFVVSSKNKLLSDEQSNLDRNIKMKKPVFFRFRANDENVIEFSFKKFVQVAYIYIYNIDDLSVDTRKGIKRLSLYADNNIVTGDKGLYIKKGSKHGFMRKYPQRVSFPISQLVHNVKPKPSPTIPISSPTGFSLEFHLKSTFGDPYYIGLNGIEIFDLMGNNLLVKENETNFNVIAEPAGVFVMPEMAKDPRNIKNIYSGSNWSEDAKDIWLTPFVKFDKNYSKNIIVVEFKNPVILGIINIWNYTKSHHRAVKDLEIYLDDNLIFCGPLNNIKERMLSSIVFNEVFNKKKVDHIKLDPITCEVNERSALNNEGTVLNRMNSDKYLGLVRPTTGFNN